MAFYLGKKGSSEHSYNRGLFQSVYDWYRKQEAPIKTGLNRKGISKQERNELWAKHFQNVLRFQGKLAQVRNMIREKDRARMGMLRARVL